MSCFTRDHSTYYFLADVRNPTRFGEIMYGPGSEPYFSEAIASIEAKRVRYILWDSRLTGNAMKTWFPTYQGPPTVWVPMEVFQAHYEQVATLDGYRVFAVAEDPVHAGRRYDRSTISDGHAFFQEPPDGGASRTTRYCPRGF